MWTLLANLSTLLMGAAAAASLSETLAQGNSRRKIKHQLQRGMVMPHEAARELQHEIGGRVAVGRDLNGYVLVVIRVRPGITPPVEYGGYRVKLQPKL